MKVQVFDFTICRSVFIAAFSVLSTFGAENVLFDAKPNRYHPTFVSVRKPSEDVARPVPSFLRSAVMYQIFPRMFTREGTLAAARALLPHIKSLGVDIVYLCPVTLSDDDPRPAFWSGRQKASKLGNPKNPYRIKDFFAIDPEYGTADDLRTFVTEAHRLGIKVLFDLVYFHCGPSAVFLKEHPDFIVRNVDGSPKIGDWKFPELNLENPALREYLYTNMLWWLKSFGADGFRCDVGDMLPVSFWEEARRRCEEIRPGSLLMCEGLRGDDQHAAFDLTYGFYTQWAIRSLLRRQKPASELRTAWEKERIDYPRGFHWMRCFDNHDFAMDTTMNGGRYEARHGSEACASMLATVFLLDGTPMLYNGQEIADNAPHSIFSNRFYGRMGIDWSRALTPAGAARMDLVRKLTVLRHQHPALFDAPFSWPDTGFPNDVYALKRLLPKSEVLLIVNVAAETRSVRLPDLAHFQTLASGTDVRVISENAVTLPPKTFYLGVSAVKNH